MNKFANFAFLSSRIDRRHVQLAIVLLSLAMLVLGIGAPSEGGGA